ncbi:fatty acid desaturase [Mucilaginibacter sp. SG564]|uniref:fatty acid desaturase family protein n=1 Tax=unclassified Mucilaginibacter TaxID=2617802 RepID=UPI0015582391|nr:fatty acid desaturase [Mucilaginibacter sp. SG564]NOW95732.1 linoleoyl-CoA desaturase [Mucilaginibacter sp. SG564]
METEKLTKLVFKKAGDDDFFKELHKEVQARVLINKNIQRRIVYKSIFLITLYFAFYTSILVWGNNTQLLFLFYILTGLTMILVFFNAFHDAVHGAVFRTRASNERLSCILELFGSNSFIWKKRHLLLHHPYPNMQQWDIDVKQSDIVRIFPGSRWLQFHRYQHIYMWFLYFFYTLNWLLIRDFKDFFGLKDNYVKRVIIIPKIEYVKLFAAKFFYLFMMIGIPALLLEHPIVNIITAFLVMHFIASAFGVTALLSTHADEDAEFPMPPENGVINTTWAMYQISKTKDFSTQNRFANFLFGGFNHHVAHHLFPAVAHTYYPYITPIIRRYAQKYRLNYRSYPLLDAIRSHFALLKKNGSAENLFVTGDL